MTSNAVDFDVLIATVERSDLSEARKSLREIVGLLHERIESDLSLLNDPEAEKKVVFKSLSESLAISNGWTLRILKNKSLISEWEGEWIDFINSLEVLYRDQCIPLYNKTVWLRDYLASNSLNKLDDYSNGSDVNTIIHQLYFEVFSTLMTIMAEIPKEQP